MAGVKSLAKDTAVYGLSSIVGRFLNWMLVPLYTHCFAVDDYGIVTYVYSVVALAMVVLTYGMETGFFRFANHERWNDPMEVYSTALISLTGSSVVFGVNIGLNLFFILLCPWLMEHVPGSVEWFYRPEFGIGYIFLANLIASAVNIAMMIPELCGFRWRFNARLWREMLRYSLPLLVLGVAGIMNQTIDKILYPSLVSDPAEAMYGLGIYGANYKIAVVLLVFLQAFRFAYEPFIFARAKTGSHADREESFAAYRDAMKYFVVFALFIFLAVMFFLGVLRHFVAERYFSGLKVVPLVMLAELFFGIFFNLSVWYKLTDRTVWGMWFSLMGLATTVILNIVLVPQISYMGCAVAALCSYGFMMAVSYIVGAHKYPIGYPVRRIALYFALAGAMYLAGVVLLPMAGIGEFAQYAVRVLLLSLYLWTVVKIEHIRPAELLAPVLSRLRRR